MDVWKRLRSRVTRSFPRRIVVHWWHRGLGTADAFVASYPRSGSTWLRFMLFELVFGQQSEFETVNRQIPDIGRQKQAPRILPDGGRLIKTHEPFSPRYQRAVYLVRDPRDVAVSEYHFHLWRGLYDGKLDPFIDRFLRDGTTAYGPWDVHVRSWIESRLANTGDLLVLRFEDMRSDTAAALRTIAAFLRIRVTSQQISRAIANTSIRQMKEKEERARTTVLKSARSDERFIRSGASGGWQGELAPELVERCEERFGELMRRFEYPIGGSCRADP